MKKLSESIIKEIKDLYYYSNSFEKIASKLSLSIPTIKKYIEERGFFTLHEQYIFNCIAKDLDREGKIKIINSSYPLFDLSEKEFALVCDEYDRQFNECPDVDKLAKRIYERNKRR